MKKQLNEPTIKANRSNSNEVQGLISEFPKLGIEETLDIKEYNAHCYVLLALRSQYNAMTGKTKWTKHVFTKTEEVWNSLTSSDKTAYRMAAAQRVAILHNPTLETEEETASRKSSDPIELTEAQKEDVAELKEGGASLKDVAKQLNLRQKDVQTHYDSVK